MIGAIITGITSLATGWMEDKRAKSKAKAEHEIKQLAAVTDYDTEALRQKQHSWSDEYLLLVHTFPWWGYIIPSEGLTERLDLLWNKMDTIPQSWWVIYGGMVISTFGLRFMAKKIIK